MKFDDCIKIINTVKKYKDDGFNKFQLREIIKGLLLGIDIENYALKCYSSQKMEEIRNSLTSKSNLVKNCDLYMIEEVMKWLELNLPIKDYYDKKYNFRQLREIRKGLIKKIDTKIYENPQLDFSMMEIIRNMKYMLSDIMSDNVIKLYANPKLTANQLYIIKLIYSIRSNKIEFCDINDNGDLTIKINHE